MSALSHAPFDPPALTTVGDVITKYMAHCASVGTHSPEAREDRERVLGSFGDRFGTMSVDQARPFHLTDFIAAHPSWKSTATKRAKANYVRAAFAWAVNQERIARNPFVSVKYAEAEPRPPMPDDVFEELCATVNKRFERALRFLRLTGCRLSEMCSLEWPDIDFDRNVAVVRRHKTRKHTGKPKLIPLVAEAVELLKEIGARQPNGYLGIVFLNNRDKPWNRRTLGQNLRRMKKQHGVATVATLHGLRHQFGTEAIRNGAPLKLVSLALGHATSAITERYYAHVAQDSEEVRDAARLAMPKQQWRVMIDRTHDPIGVIRDILAKGPVPAPEFHRLAHERGIPVKLIRQSAKAAGASCRKVGNAITGGGWVWELARPADRRIKRIKGRRGYCARFWVTGIGELQEALQAKTLVEALAELAELKRKSEARPQKLKQRGGARFEPRARQPLHLTPREIAPDALARGQRDLVRQLVRLFGPIRKIEEGRQEGPGESG